VARRRLGVVLLVPQPTALQIDGLRRALGDGALGRIPPHITLVPPVNVAERDLPTAFSAVRRAAGGAEPLTLRLGPVATFAPVNPVAYLAVGGDPSVLDHLTQLRSACLTGPLERTIEHDFVPHVTVADDLPADRLAAAVVALARFEVSVTFDRVHVLAEQPGRVWAPVADAPLAEAGGVVGRGSLPLELSTSGRPDAEAAGLLATVAEPAGLPYAVTARREGAVVATAWGWSGGDALEVADLVVAAEHRGQGIGRHVVAAVEALARRRGCVTVGLTAPAAGAAASLLSACGFVVEGAAGGDRRRWTHTLTGVDLAPEPGPGGDASAPGAGDAG
jgi:2'-5' RNA ligase/predicted GNAT family acetyltransferase